MDRFSRICLLLIVVFLAVIAIRPVLSPPPVRAWARYTQYDAYATNQLNVNKLPEVLTHAAEGGWDVIAVTTLPHIIDGNTDVLIILGK